MDANGQNWANVYVADVVVYVVVVVVVVVVAHLQRLPWRHKLSRQDEAAPGKKKKSHFYFLLRISSDRLLTLG